MNTIYILIMIGYGNYGGYTKVAEFNSQGTCIQAIFDIRALQPDYRHSLVCV